MQIRAVADVVSFVEWTSKNMLLNATDVKMARNLGLLPTHLNDCRS